MKKIKLKNCNKGMKVFLNDERVNKIVNLLLVENEKIIFSKILKLINSTFTIEELVDNSQIFFNTDEKYFSRLNEYWQPLCDIYSDSHIGGLRGALVEKLVYRLLKMKYGNLCDTGMSCRVGIDSWTSDKDVDVFFNPLNEAKGESYGCKMNPDNFIEDDINNIKDIFFESGEKIYPRVASFSSVETVKLRLQQLHITIGHLNYQLNYFGYENFKEMCIK